MESVILFIGMAIFGIGILMLVAALFLGEYKDLIPTIITIAIGSILIFNSDNIISTPSYGDVIETHYKIEPKIKIIEYTQPYTNIKYKDTVFVYARKYQVKGD